MVGKKAVFSSLVLVALPLPRPLSDLASRSELTAWLTRLLMNIMVPGQSQPAPNYIMQPNNHSAFIGLLVHLHRVGFPGHWLADFLQTILSGGMVTDIAPYDDKWPIQTTDMSRRVKSRRVRFDPWLADFENILAACHEGLPFSFTLPPDFAKTVKELGTYATSMEINDPLLAQAFHPRDPNMTLVFYKKQAKMSEHYILCRINDILGNVPFDPPWHKVPQPGEIVILTALEAFEGSGEVRWKMNRKRAREMLDSDGEWLVVGSRSCNMNAPGMSCTFIFEFSH